MAGYNVVIETTMRQPIVVVGTMEAFKQKGHVPELRVLFSLKTASLEFRVG